MQCFNSTMVRLKVVDAQKKAQQAVFQFHYGTIKSHEFLFILELSSYFNSTMVRLKGRTCGFHDSKGVQFQFHYGTIKRVPRAPTISCVAYFNSTMVRLKGVHPSHSPHLRIFQFHYGTIKRRFREKRCCRNVKFQFHYGTIKRVSSETFVSVILISIPLWYD